MVGIHHSLSAKKQGKERGKDVIHSENKQKIGKIEKQKEQGIQRTESQDKKLDPLFLMHTPRDFSAHQVFQQQQPKLCWQKGN